MFTNRNLLSKQKTPFQKHCIKNDVDVKYSLDRIHSRKGGFHKMSKTKVPFILVLTSLCLFAFWLLSSNPILAKEKKKPIKNADVSQGCFEDVSEVRSPTGLYSILLIKDPRHDDWAGGYLYLRNLKTGEMHLVHTYISTASAIWSPQGDKVAITSSGGGDSDWLIVFTDGEKTIDYMEMREKGPFDPKYDEAYQDFDLFYAHWLTNDSLEIEGCTGAHPTVSSDHQVTMKYEIGHGFTQAKPHAFGHSKSVSH